MILAAAGRSKNWLHREKYPDTAIRKIKAMQNTGNDTRKMVTLENCVEKNDGYSDETFLALRNAEAGTKIVANLRSVYQFASLGGGLFFDAGVIIHICLNQFRKSLMTGCNGAKDGFFCSGRNKQKQLVSIKQCTAMQSPATKPST